MLHATCVCLPKVFPSVQLRLWRVLAPLWNASKRQGELLCLHWCLRIPDTTCSATGGIAVLKGRGPSGRKGLNFGVLSDILFTTAKPLNLVRRMNPYT